MNATLLQQALAEGIKVCKETNAGTIKIVPKNAAGEPLAALIVVYGKVETKEIVAACDAVEEKW